MRSAKPSGRPAESHLRVSSRSVPYYEPRARYSTEDSRIHAAVVVCVLLGCSDPTTSRTVPDEIFIEEIRLVEEDGYLRAAATVRNGSTKNSFQIVASPARRRFEAGKRIVFSFHYDLPKFDNPAAPKPKFLSYHGYGFEPRQLLPGERFDLEAKIHLDTRTYMAPRHAGQEVPKEPVSVRDYEFVEFRVGFYMNKPGVASDLTLADRRRRFGSHARTATRLVARTKGLR